MNEKMIEAAYLVAKDRYADYGVDTERAIAALSGVSLSLHCWQGDDVGGFESPDAELSGGGIQVTGSYPGKARNASELRTDLEKALSLIPGKHRVNLHAIYGEFGGKRVDRDEIEPEHFAGWVEWAKAEGVALDFNATLFSHEKASDGFTLSHRDRGIRDFWIDHCARARRITAWMGSELGMASVHNLWIPDGSKEIPVDRQAPRSRLLESLDSIYSKSYPTSLLRDAVECKLFGIGSESYVVGSHEFYMGYAMRRGLMLCLDLGHFHPTESVADKISSVLLYTDDVLLHVSRGVRWDSDHVVIAGDELADLSREIVANGLDRVRIALDYFDGTLNRVGAWVTGCRATQKSLLAALLDPRERLAGYEEEGRFFERLALREEMKTMPIGDVWNYFCLKSGTAAGTEWIDQLRCYEVDALLGRA